jgi:hypothetical protein
MCVATGNILLNATRNSYSYHKRIHTLTFQISLFRLFYCILIVRPSCITFAAASNIRISHDCYATAAGGVVVFPMATTPSVSVYRFYAYP